MKQARVRLAVAVAAAGALVAMAAVAAAGGGGGIHERLTGFEEPPALSTKAGGEFHARLDRRRATISYKLRYTGMADVQQVHIHLGQRAVRGGVSVWLCGNAGGPLAGMPPGTQRCPPAPATIRGEIRPADVVGPADQGIEPREFGELVRALRAGATYVNVHSAEHPGGEIRAQLEKGVRR